ncbi:MAG: TA system VapC family ribonuclease toxin [Jiangellaceae bacterium]
MILVDANILIYAYVADYREHQRALRWLERQLGEAPRLALPWASLLSFVRLVTNPRLFDPAAPIDAAHGQVRRWLAADGAWCPEPTARHADILGELLLVPGLRADDVPDAHLAALAIEHGLTLATNDRGFARFDGLRLTNPVDERG